MTWTRARVEECCGHCRAPIGVGAPMRTYRLPTVRGGRSVKVRCPACADEPVPADLPAFVASADGPGPVDLSRLAQRFGALPLVDFKSRAVEREPGEDDE